MIKKQNSSFTTAFTSEANTNLKNTDCFAHVELDEYACYVLADGIDDKYGAKAARLCVDTIISAFTEEPSISKKALKKYLNIANQRLEKEKRKTKQKASVIIIVHNYTKMRYAQAGNVRFRLYRDGFLKAESKDQSLSMDLVIGDRLPKDLLEKHEERHNLYTYIGQKKDFSPFISKKLKLTNTDSITLSTKGFWENVDEGEILDIFKDAGTDPQEIINTAEDVLLSKQPKKLESYSFVTIFVEKVFINPSIKRKIKKIIMIAIPIITIISVIGVIMWVRYSNKQEKIELMNDNFLETMEYILADNYIKAEKTATKTIDLASQVKDQDMKDNATNYLMLIESIISGDDHLSNKSYEDAQNQYLNALDRSRFADKLSEEYIGDKLELTANYIAIYDLIVLGDTQVLNLQYDEAEEKYLQAKILSSKIYFDEGRQSALKALEDLYALQKELAEQSKKETDSTIEKETSATNFIAQGDKAFLKEDYEGALVFYTSAKQKYDELEDDINSEIAIQKIESTQSKLEDNISKHNQALENEKLAEDFAKDEDYVMAKKHYLLAKDLYARIKDDSKVKEITTKLEILDLQENGELDDDAPSIVD